MIKADFASAFILGRIGDYLGRHADFRQISYRRLDRLRRIFVVIELPAQEGFVGAQVKVAMT